MGLRDLFRSKTSEPTTLAAPARGVAQWVPAGQPIYIDGRTIPGGMVYIGTKTASVDKTGMEPALIDPALKVQWDRPDLEGEGMDYWPSYSYIPPSSRAAFLQWLATGRSDPSAYIGYVFLYFYGLERRLLAETELDPSHPDTALIAAELRRLIEIYGENYSFRFYASSLLSILEARTLPNGEITPPIWDPANRGWELPLTVKVGIGRYLAAGEPIPPNWALCLLLHHPEAYLRTPAIRCRAEFEALFVSKYSAQYGPGLKIKPPATKIKVEYRPASGGIRTDVAVSIDALPDITRAVALFNKLKELASECTDLLDPYSRYLGRYADGAGTAEAISLLPDELLASHGGKMIDDLRTWTGGLFGDQRRVAIALDDLVVRWSPGRVEKLAKRDAVALAGLLGKLGVGIEPDVRFGSSTPVPNTKVVLFPLAAAAPTAPSSAYSAAASLVYLAAIVAASDDAISEVEQLHLAQHLETVLGLDPIERERLEAHLAWLATGKPAMAGIKKKVDVLPTHQRAAIGRFLVDIAATDGTVSRDEITTLTKIFSQLGLAEEDVYRQVHSLGNGDAGPVTVKTADTTTRWDITSPTAPALAAVVLDPAKVQARLAETAGVTALLATIFAEDEPQASPIANPWAQPSTTTAAHNAASIAGLDSAHSTLATAIVTRDAWERDEAEQLAASLGLPLLDGAIDRINEATIEACGDPLIDGDDPLEVNDFAKQELFC